MGLSLATVWWVAVGVLVAVELATGTFYLLMLAVGAVAGAVAAHLGLTLSAQIVVAALIGGGATAAWHWKRRHEPRSADVRENRDVNLDVGERVSVTTWSADGTARVAYRGTTWTARLAAGAPMLSGEHTVQAVEGNWLVLQPTHPR